MSGTFEEVHIRLLLWERTQNFLCETDPLIGL